MKKLCLFITVLCLCLALAPWCAAKASAEAPAADLDKAASTALAALDRHIEEMRDNYCVYYDPDEYQLMMGDYAGSFGGVGVSMILSDDGYVTVYKVLDEGPAKDSPIKAGDRIIAVDGENIVGQDTDQAALRIRGEVGTPVTLTMLDADGEQYELTLVRQEITTHSVEGDRVAEPPDTATNTTGCGRKALSNGSYWTCAPTRAATFIPPSPWLNSSYPPSRRWCGRRCPRALPPTPPPPACCGTSN